MCDSPSGAKNLGPFRKYKVFATRPNSLITLERQQFEYAA